MPACPHCRQTISGQPGTMTLCPHCGGRVRLFRPSPMRRSIPPMTCTGPKPHSRPIRQRTEASSELAKKFEYTPQSRKAQVSRPVKLDKVPHQSCQSFGEINESGKMILFNLPLEENQFSWKIEGNLLKIKSLRLDFRYTEEIKIPPEWKDAPEVVFLNGVLVFYW